MEYSSIFVCLMGMGTVFFGLICLIALTYLMSAVVGRGKKAAPAPVPAAPQTAGEVTPELVAAVSAALAEELGGVIGEAECVLVSMLAGVTLERLEALFPGKRILRIMPNTPCAVVSGMLFLCRGSLAAEQDAKAFRQLMACAGRIDEIPEKWMDAASAVAGCGPAFAYMFVQALADGGVECGLPRAKATEYAAQMLLGSAQMVLQTGAHPEKLKDDVCSPGGSTIAGVHALENAAFRAACMDAVTAAYERTKGLG